MRADAGGGPCAVPFVRSVASCRLSFVSVAIFIALLAGLMSAFAHAEGLDIARLFEEPALAGPTVRLPRIAPDGSRVAFLRAAADDINRFDLWEYNVADDQTRLLVDSRALEPEDIELSDEEKARRERERVSAFSGIIEYYFSDDGTRLLFPIGGDVYLYDLTAAPARATRRLTDDPATETDVRFSPGGRFVSFIRGQNLYVISLADGREHRLTQDGGGVIRNGMAEFVAQEEMGRSTGYWWSPDERHIAFTRTDDSPVDEVNRFEIYAEDFKVVPQRYPAAGTANVRIELGVLAVPGSGAPGSGGEADPGGDAVIDADVDAGGVPTPRWMQLGLEPDGYLPRVAWFPDSAHLLVQRQSRDQKSLDLLKVDIASGRPRLLLSETSTTWIDLHDDLYFLEQSNAFIWASARSGYKHLYLYTNEGRLIRPLTAGEWMVAGGSIGDGLLAVDEQAGLVYFTATRESPLERQLYATSLVTRTPQQVRRISRRDGMHRIDFASDASIYVDTFTNVDTPEQVSVHRADGERLAWLQENRLDAEHPFAPYLADYRRPEFGELTAEDGQTLYYQLIKPAGFDPARRYPVVVDVYGGPHGQKVKNQWLGADFRQVLAQSGYVVFTLDNRGTSYRGTRFDAPIHQQLGQVEVRDQRVGIEFLRRLPYVDPQRIGVFGWSYGGYMTLMMMTQLPDLLAAGVSGAPVTDWRLYDTHYTERYMGDPRQDGDAYDAASVFSRLDGLNDPLLIVHGMTDDNVLFSNSTRLFTELQDRALAFDVMVYPGAKHGLLRHQDKGPHGYQTIKRFLDLHLRPDGP
jgi:dipeptidyl-peptidase-4